MNKGKKIKSFNDIMQTFVQNFFTCCDKMKMSLAMISKLTGISKHNLHNYRYNKKQISGKKLFKMAEDCNIARQKVFILDFQN